MRRFHPSTIAGSCALALAGCVLTPDGTRAERERLADAARSYADRSKPLPELSSAAPSADELFQRAALANGELEAAFHAWRAALARVDVEGAWPNTNVALDLEYMLSSGGMSAFDRTTVGVGFDPMENLDWPSERKRAAQAALADARAAGERFRAARFALKRRVIDLALDGALSSARVRSQRARADLARVANDTAAARIQTGARQQELVAAQLELARAETDLAREESALRATEATLDALLARDPSQPIAFPMPAPRAVPADEVLLAAGVASSPELAALAHAVEGREDALEVARLRYLPDVNPFFVFTGSVSQSVGAMLSLPLHRAKLRAEVEIAHAELDRARAIARQARADRAAELVARVFALRSSERQSAYFDATLAPALARLEQEAAEAYASGSAGLGEWIETRTAALELEVARAEVRVDRERTIAAIEELIGVDVESLMAETTLADAARDAREETKP